jgi:magnesium-protoporphyrin IX monomethyl ester (oxidative) cyclase
MEVFRITNTITQQVFPLALDIENPTFFTGLEKLVEIAKSFDEAKSQGGMLGLIKRAWHGSRALFVFARLYFLPVKAQHLLENPRLRPTW